MKEVVVGIGKILFFFFMALLSAMILLEIVDHFIGDATHDLTLNELRSMVEECEKDLPRDKTCSIIAVPNE